MTFWRKSAPAPGGTGRSFRPGIRLNCLDLEHRPLPATRLAVLRDAPAELVTAKFGDDLGFLFHDYSVWSRSHTGAASGESYSPAAEQPNGTLLRITGDRIAVDTVART